jgi:hypothetical protein
MSSLFPLLLVTHIALAIALFVPSLLLPFTLRARRATVDSGSGLVQVLIWMQARGTAIIGFGLLASGLGLIAALGLGTLGQPWLIAALSLYAVDLGIAFFIQRPNLRRLIGIKADADDRVWASRARRQRYLSYAMAFLVGTIGFLMSTKPELW